MFRTSPSPVPSVLYFRQKISGKSVRKKSLVRQTNESGYREKSIICEFLLSLHHSRAFCVRADKRLFLIQTKMLAVIAVGVGGFFIHKHKYKGKQISANDIGQLSPRSDRQTTGLAEATFVDSDGYPVGTIVLEVQVWL
jgi:hypothetical protein